MDLIENVRALLMEKQASEVAAQANLSAEPNAAMAAAQSAVDAAAKQSGGTVEQQATESLQKGLATQSAEAGAYDKVEAELDKAAALLQLMDEGDGFYEAFEKVAQADMDLQKQAAYEALVEAGMGFEEAVSLVKEAAEKGPYGYGNAFVGNMRAGGRSLVDGVGGAAIGAATGMGVGAMLDKTKYIGSGGAGKLLRNRLTSKSGKAGALAAATAGLYAGAIHGGLASSKNQLNEAHARGKAGK